MKCHAPVNSRLGQSTRGLGLKFRKAALPALNCPRRAPWDAAAGPRYNGRMRPLPAGDEEFAANRARSRTMAMMRLRAATVLCRLLVSILSAMAAALLAAPASAAKRAVVLDVDGAIGPAMADYIVRELQGRERRRRRPRRAAHEHAGRPRYLDAPDHQRHPRLAGAGRHLRRAGRRAGGQRRHLHRLCERDRRHGAGHQYRRRHAGSARRRFAASGGGGSEQKQQGKKPARTARTPRPARSSTTRSPISSSLATLNNRNADWAADAVRSAVSVPATEALTLHVIDVIANDVPDLLRQIDGKTVTVNGKPQHLATAGLTRRGRSRRTGAPSFSASSPIRTSPSSSC